MHFKKVASDYVHRIEIVRDSTKLQALTEVVLTMQVPKPAVNYAAIIVSIFLLC
jgi:hypothetical protein